MQVSNYQFFLSKPNTKGTLKKQVNEDQLQTVPFPTNKRFPSFCSVVDSRKDSKTRGRKVTVRYVEGEPSIYVDEQNTKWDLKEYREGNLPSTPIYFNQGRINVSASNVTLLEYLRICPWNTENNASNNYTGVAFHEFKPEAEAKKSFTTERGTFMLEKEAYIMSLDKAMAILRVSDKVNHVNVFTAEGGKSEEGLRWELILMIKNNPELFRMVAEDPRLMIKYDILTAIDRDILTWVGQYKEILSYRTTGEVICATDQTRDKLDFSAEYLITKALPTLNGIRTQLGRTVEAEAEKNEGLDSKLDFIQKGTKEQIVDKIIEDHRDRDKPSVFDVAKGNTVKFGGTPISIDDTKVSGYQSARLFLNDPENQPVYEAVMAEWMKNSK